MVKFHTGSIVCETEWVALSVHLVRRGEIPRPTVYEGRRKLGAVSALLAFEMLSSKVRMRKESVGRYPDVLSSVTHKETLLV